MRPLILALVGLLLVPAAVAGKGRDAPVRVLWNSAPGDVRASGTWDARLSLLQGPGGFFGRNVHPVIVVTRLATGAERRVPMTIDVGPNTFRARVAFPHAGTYAVAVAGFDPRHPTRRERTSGPVHVEAAAPPVAAAGTGGAWWAWALMGTTIAALLAAAQRIPRLRGRPTP